MSFKIDEIEIISSDEGVGGSAVVHKGRVVVSREGLPDLGEYVAVKQYHESILKHADQDRRILQERTVGAGIDHPNVVKVYDWPPVLENSDVTFLVMEWIEGSTLDEWSQNLRKNAAWERICNICVQLIDGVAELHSKGVFHRDIKPENVMVSQDRAKLMDIGVAEITGNNEHTLHTAVKDFVGSVRFASPQFIFGEEFHALDDVYSIGATLYVVLTGRLPYSDVERKPVLPIEVTRRPPEVGKLRDNVPAAMRVVLQGCLNRKRERRPTLTQLRDAFVNDSTSEYVESELRRQAGESGYAVIRLDGPGGGFYADVGDGDLTVGNEYRVVRKSEPVNVPSLGASVQPEKWIASADLRHIHQNVGHFKLITKVWVPGKAKGIYAHMISTGHWTDRDLKSESVEIGDIVAIDPEEL